LPVGLVIALLASCATADSETASVPLDAGKDTVAADGAAEAAADGGADVEPEAGGSAGTGGAAGSSGKAGSGASGGKAGAAGKAGTGGGGTGGTGGAADGGLPCGSAVCVDQWCKVPNQPVELTYYACCTNDDRCGAAGAPDGGIICVALEDLAKLGITCHPQ
jgi:hypothetical protein